MSFEVLRPICGNRVGTAPSHTTWCKHLQKWPHRRRLATRRSLRVFAEPDSEIDPKTFDEGAAQVRRLMNRDRSKYAGPDFEALMENQFASDTVEDVSSPSDLNDTDRTTENVKPVSPFGSATKKAVNPFGTTPPMKPESLMPEQDPEDEDEEPWWSFIKNITPTQIVLACSFVLITSTMLGTFFFVLNSGAIHFNE